MTEKKKKTEINLEVLYNNSLQYGKELLKGKPIDISIKSILGKHRFIEIKRLNGTLIGSISFDKYYNTYSMNVCTPPNNSTSYQINVENYKKEMKIAIEDFCKI